MTGLEQAFYIIGIVFMSLILILIIALVAAVFIIKSKIDRIHEAIGNKVGKVARLAEAGSAIAKKAKRKVS